MTTSPPESNGEQPVDQTPEPTAPPAPAAPSYEAPPAPPAPPVQPPAAPAPPAGGYEQAPPAGGYQQPPAAGYQQPVADPTSNITLNYWLSVFFTWLPALIFWLIEKDKGDQRAAAIHAANLNFSLLRTAVYLIIWIPYIGWIIGGIGGIVLFVFHIMAAVKAAETYRGSGKPDPFIFNIPLVK